ncbi:Fur family transcriptional regulator [Clostridiisalibacter paucivorans]|uniref:Fur family transcriptional regulator n=1 Tax=Clostridiisalibacter paucivorans TaxID=408753 RepID=UPI000478AE77|nr:Fur family transcriptional regulator [Clostridiisalibacter paucivorans]
MIGFKDLEQKLKDNGYKTTKQRRAILQVLYENVQRFISAEDIYNKTKEKFNTTNFSTVYRNLEILERLGIIHKTNIEDGISVYELICHREHHHHIICKKCGKTEIIDFCPFENIEHILDDKGFEATEHKFEVYGYCSKCKSDV